MRELALVGFVTLAFGLSALRIQGGFSLFSGLNLGLGGLALAGALVLALRSAREAVSSAPREPLRRALLVLLAVTAVGIAAERGGAALDWSSDWSFEGEYELADATRQALRALPQLRMTVYREGLDPRIRRTRLLVERMSAVNGAEMRVREISSVPEDEDRFGIGSSNSVVLEAGSAWQLVERPTEGALFEALSRLADHDQRVLYVTIGTGEGDLRNTTNAGYSGLSAALETEGYLVKPFPTAFATDLPPDTDAVLVIAPARRLQEDALHALQRYLERGGRLVAMLEPERQSGLDEVLSEWGIVSPPSVLVDPASASLEGETPGLAPVAFNYADHPVVHGLDSNRVTFFRGVRGLSLRKPQVEDRLRAVVTGSAESWISDDPGLLDARRMPEPPAGARTDYHPIVAVGRYQRGERETRIVAFGDADFASNRYLRALYNLDLVMNALHWVSEREPSITLRPKTGTVMQFPVPIQNSLGALYGAGLLVPEILLLAGGLAWVRRRGA